MRLRRRLLGAVGSLLGLALAPLAGGDTPFDAWSPDARPARSERRVAEPGVAAPGRRGGKAATPAGSGFAVEGSHFFVWDEDRVEAEGWAGELVDSDPRPSVKT